MKKVHREIRYSYIHVSVQWSIIELQGASGKLLYRLKAERKMIYMKQLRTVCLAGLITVSLAAVCHAEVTTKVAVKDYMPQVNTLYVDDDFNDQQSETPQVSTAYANPVKKYADEDVTVASETDGNKFLKLNSTKGFIYPVARETIGKKKLTISFDVQKGDAASIYLEIGRGKENQTYHAKFATLNVWSSGGTVDFAGADGAAKRSKQFAALADNAWTNVTMTFERKKQADGTYVSEVTELFVAGKQIDLGAAAGAALTADWWTGSINTEGTLSIRSTKTGNYIDNLLIYEPVDKTETIVEKSAYMPEIKTLIADDGFENRPADQRANTAVTYAIPYPVKIGMEGTDGTFSENGWGSYVRQDDTGNKYLELGGHWRSGPYTPGANNTDKLAVSFEVGYKSGSSSTCNGKIYIGKSVPIAFQLYSNQSIKLFYDTENGDATSSSAQNVYKAAADKHKIELVFKREVDNAADGGYNVYMENMYIDGSEVAAVRGVRFGNIDWWSSDNAYTFRLRCNEPYAVLDSFLIYEPIADEEVHALVTSFPEIKGDIAENSSVTASATVTNTSGADKKVLAALAIYEDGMLKNIKMQEFDVPNGTKDVSFVSDPLVCRNISSDKAYGAKAFVWSDMVSVTGD